MIASGDLVQRFVNAYLEPSRTSSRARRKRPDIIIKEGEFGIHGARITAQSSRSKPTNPPSSAGRNRTARLDDRDTWRKSIKLLVASGRRPKRSIEASQVFTDNRPSIAARAVAAEENSDPDTRDPISRRRRARGTSDDPRCQAAGRTRATSRRSCWHAGGDRPSVARITAASSITADNAKLNPTMKVPTMVDGGNRRR